METEATVPVSLVSTAASPPFRELYERFFPGVYNYVCYRVRDRTAVDDVVSTIFEKALRGYGSYDAAKGAAAAWIYTIARNCVRDRWRRDRRRRATSIDSLEEQRWTGEQPEEALARREIEERVRRAVGELAPREQELIALRFGASLGVKEIASIRRMREGTVAVVLHRAYRKLRLRLIREEERE